MLIVHKAFIAAKAEGFKKGPLILLLLIFYLIVIGIPNATEASSSILPGIHGGLLTTPNHFQHS
jgi:hypothetical protein